ncbi:MAG: type IV secretory system conjugative DNA transfer family protein [Lachnospiraceae bacterium]|nr:type IV secretory system conjugative DNA transfer family protein [Lachnospiraceae bacterium]
MLKQWHWGVKCKKHPWRMWLKILLALFGFVLLSLYVGGFFRLLAETVSVSLNPAACICAALSPVGLRFSLLVLPILALTAALVIWRGKGREIAGTDEERNFDYSAKGTYGTAGFMGEGELSSVLESHADAADADGVIFGTDIKTGDVLSLPIDSYLNRNFAVCGSQGSMKSRAFARVMALQCIKRGESIYLTDPKSELYEDLVVYLRSQGYTIRRLNLIDLACSDAWDCLGEIGDGGMIDIFVDVVIRNTTDKFDHFYDNTEMDLLKALCLYVYEEYPSGRRTFPEAYNLLLNKSVEALDAIFERLPTGHPARGPYQLFSKADKVKGNAVLGLGTRLQIFQNKTLQQLTSYPEIDLELPGKEKCAYFCITSDQDSTYNMLATLFTSFLCIRLVRCADHTPERRLPVPVHMILDEFPNIGVVPDFKKKLATARSRGIGISVLFQNLPQMQNRYPDNQWEEILGGCDFSLFLGCNDLTTAEYFSRRSGEITVSVDNVRKNFYTIRLTDYVPQYSESSSVGKRQILLPDELLRYPHDLALLFIRGQNALKIRKMDYTKHPAAQYLKLEKTTDYVPEWRRTIERAEEGRAEDSMRKKQNLMEADVIQGWDAQVSFEVQEKRFRQDFEPQGQDIPHKFKHQEQEVQKESPEEEPVALDDIQKKPGNRRLSGEKQVCRGKENVRGDSKSVSSSSGRVIRVEELFAQRKE